MAQKTIDTMIVLHGVIDNSFGRIGSELIGMGSQIDEISSKLIDFGKDSVNVYESYETNLKYIGSLLENRGDMDVQAAKRMTEDLNVAMQHWASTSIFTTSDVSRAVKEAVVAGWDYNDVLEVIPSAMKLAQAGEMDLTQAVQQIITVNKAAKISLAELPAFLDDWAMTAFKTSTTVMELGEALSSLSANAWLAGDWESLLTLFGILADNGIRGSEAATLLRNTMLRIVAPTNKAEEALAALGATEEEMEQIIGDSGMQAYKDFVEKTGFSAYDAEGNLKNMWQIFKDIYDLTADYSEQQRIDLFSSIFSTRSITGANAIYKAVADGFDLYDVLKGTLPDGIMDRVVEDMMSGLFGARKIMESKLEALKLKVGDALKDDVIEWMGYAGDFLDTLNGMNTDQFNVIIQGLTGLAEIGPALLFSGAALRLIGYLFTPTGAIAGAITLATSMVKAINEFNEVEFQNKFGDMAIDQKALGDYVKTLGKDFEESYKNINAFSAALDTATNNYQTASATFSSNLLTAMLTNTKFTPEDLKKLQDMADAMYVAVSAAIDASSNRSANFWAELLSGEENNQYLSQILDLLEIDSQELMAEANAISQNINELMMKGFKDGISEEEYQIMLGYFDEYNRLVAKAQREAANKQAEIEMNTMLYRAQNASLDEIQGMSEEVRELRDAQLEKYRSDFESEIGRLMTDKNDGKITEEEYNELKDVSERAYRQNVAAYSKSFDDVIYKLWQTAANQKGLGDQYAQLGKYAEMYLNGTYSADTVETLITEQLGKSVYAGQGGTYKNTDRAQLGRLLGYAIEELGGEEAVKAKIKEYEGLSQIEAYKDLGYDKLSDNLRYLLTMEMLANGFFGIKSVEPNFLEAFFNDNGFKTYGMEPRGKDFAQRDENKDMMSDYVVGQQMSLYRMRETVDNLTEKNRIRIFFDEMGKYLSGKDNRMVSASEDINRAGGNGLNRMVETLNALYDLDAVFQELVKSGKATENNAFSDYLAMYSLLYGDASKNPDQYLLPKTTTTEQTSEYSIVGAEEAATTAHTAAQATLDELGDVTENAVVNEGTAAYDGWKAMQEEANGYFVAYPGVVTNKTNFRVPFMADGGRATQPVVFGEAGPEWFIPEEHTSNTANLLLSSMRASGFTLAELAEMAGARMFAEGGTTGNALVWRSMPDTAGTGSGGSSGGGETESGGGLQVQYSPVIHAENANGVARVLQEDKQRFEKWIREWFEKRKLYQDMAVYQ